MTSLTLFVASGVAFGLCLVVVTAMVPLLGKRGVVDIPNERSSHDRPVPRGGGVGIVAGIVGGYLILWIAGCATPPWVLAVACGTMVVLGATEDFGGELSAGGRLAVQLIAAIAVAWVLEPINRLPLPAPLDVSLGIFAWPLTLLWVVGVTNIFNFLDGIDGFAGIQGMVAGAAIGFGAFGWVAGLGVVTAASCVGFLVHNWQPARIFMGDVGSLTLGFLLAVLPLGMGPNAHLGVFVVGLALWFFLADGTFTILRRLLRRERVWQAHRSHLYQRLTIAGWSHSKVVALVACGMITVATLAVVSVTTGSSAMQWAALAVAVLLFGAYWWGVVRVEATVRYRGSKVLTGHGNTGVGKK